MGLQRQNAAKDGDCFFTSLAFQILEFLSNCDVNIRQDFDKNGITNHMTVTEIARRLRELLLQEWWGNHAEYNHLVGEDKDYTTDVEHFLTSGHFATSIGDSMPLAAANTLHIPVQLVTFVQNMPLIVTPEAETVSNVPLVLGVIQEGAGLYNSTTAIASPIQNSMDSTQTEDLHCRCGVKNKNTTFMNCCDSPKLKIWEKRRYSSRCNCLKAGMGCGEVQV